MIASTAQSYGRSCWCKMVWLLRRWILSSIEGQARCLVKRPWYWRPRWCHKWRRLRNRPWLPGRCLWLCLRGPGEDSFVRRCFFLRRTCCERKWKYAVFRRFSTRLARIEAVRWGMLARQGHLWVGLGALDCLKLLNCFQASYLRRWGKCLAVWAL